MFETNQDPIMMQPFDPVQDQITSEKPINRWSQLGFTFVPFLIYLVAESIPLPTIHYPWRGVLRFDAYSIMSVGILPWVAAAVIVELAAKLVPWWRYLRHSGPSERAPLQGIATTIGAVFAWWHATTTAHKLEFEPVIFDPNDLQAYVGKPFGPKPYSSSPTDVFVILLVATSFARLLAEIVNRRGWGHGIVTMFFAWLVASSLRSIFYIFEFFAISDVIQLAANVFIGAMLVKWFLMAKLGARTSR